MSLAVNSEKFPIVKPVCILKGAVNNACQESSGLEAGLTRHANPNFEATLPSFLLIAVFMRTRDDVTINMIWKHECYRCSPP